MARRVEDGFNDMGFSYEADLLPNVELTITEYQDGVPVTLDDDVVLTPFKTKHYLMDAYALRLESADKVLAYSGDSTISEGIKSSAREAELFLCEASSRVGQESDDGHLSPSDVGKLATELGVGQVVVTHYSGFDPIADIEQAVTSNFSGQVSIAQDLSSYTIL